MRIEPFAQVAQLYNKQQVPKTSKTSAKSFADAVTISSAGKDIQTMKVALANTADVRTELTDSIKEQIDSGSYEVSADSLAEKLYNMYNQGNITL